MHEVFQINPKKLKFFLHAPWRHIWGVEVQLQYFLITALDGGELSASLSCCPNLRKEPRYTLNRRLHNSYYNQKCYHHHHEHWSIRPSACFLSFKVMLSVKEQALNLSNYWFVISYLDGLMYIKRLTLIKVCILVIQVSVYCWWIENLNNKHTFFPFYSFQNLCHKNYCLNLNSS